MLLALSLLVVARMLAACVEQAPERHDDTERRRR